MNSNTLIIIPAYNEEKSIGSVLEGLLELGIDGDILVVNDGSADRTMDIVAAYPVFSISHPSNLGYGASLQSGYMFAVKRGYDFVVQYDADGQHATQDLLAVIAYMREATADVVIGSRFLGDKHFNPGVMKKIAIAFFRGVIRLITGKTVSDPTSGLRGLKRRAFSYYAGRRRFPSDFPDADIIIHMLLNRFAVQEIPIGSRERASGVSMHSGLKPILYFLKVLISILAILLHYSIIERRGNS
ncbi:MAG TPA: glycosyltransferase family 2 protein [Paenibacillus sp.]|nr:glycosyltransferase family 2 protein [Paenibacillus sp.]